MTILDGVIKMWEDHGMGPRPREIRRSCPTCKDNLFTQENSYAGRVPWNVSYAEYWVYHCQNCGQYSKWDPSPPVVIYVGPPTYRDLVEMKR
jgi:hypothetical protein